MSMIEDFKKYCINCGEELPKRKYKYCCQNCAYEYTKKTTKENKPKPEKKTAIPKSKHNPDNTFDDYIKAQKEAEKRGETLSYGKWAAQLYKERFTE